MNTASMTDWAPALRRRRIEQMARRRTVKNMATAIFWSSYLIGMTVIVCRALEALA